MQIFLTEESGKYSFDKERYCNVYELGAGQWAIKVLKKIFHESEVDPARTSFINNNRVVMFFTVSSNGSSHFTNAQKVIFTQG